MNYNTLKMSFHKEIDDVIKKLISNQLNEIKISDIYFRAGEYGFGRLTVDRRLEDWKEKIPELIIDDENKIITMKNE